MTDCLYNQKKILSYIIPVMHNKSHGVVITTLQRHRDVYSTFKYPAKSRVKDLIHVSQLGVDN